MDTNRWSVYRITSTEIDAVGDKIGCKVELQELIYTNLGYSEALDRIKNHPSLAYSHFNWRMVQQPSLKEEK